MPLVTLATDHLGRPIIDLYVGLIAEESDLLTESHQPAPTPQLVTALVDTGASRTVIEKSVIDLLGISPTNTEKLHSATTGTTPILANHSLVQISLAGQTTGILASNLVVVEAPDLSGLGVKVLLSRDVLKDGLLFYNGPRKQFTLTFDETNKN